MAMTRSMKFITAGMAAILTYIAVPIGYILDYFFLGTHVGYLELIGAFIIVGSNVIIGILVFKGIVK